VELRQLCEPRLDLGLVGDVEVRLDHLAERGHLQRAGSVSPAARDDARALGGERLRAGEPDAARAPRDERELSEQSLHARQYSRDMRIAGVVVALIVLVSAAHADRKALRPYAGRIVYSPD